MNENGCKVVASCGKFGETKFKPIRKQENIVKPATVQPPNKKNKIEENQPIKRVNKFFKSRNTSSVLEETNKPRPVANITPIKNLSKFKEEEKPLKIKIKKEKKTNEKVIKQSKQIEQTEPIKSIKATIKSSPIKCPSIKTSPIKSLPIKTSPIKSSPIKSPPAKIAPFKVQPYKAPAVSNQTRYSTRSRRSDPITDESNNQVEQINQIKENKIEIETNKLIENKNEDDKIEEAKIEDNKITHQYGTRRNRKKPKNDDFIDYTTKVNELNKLNSNNNIDLVENNIEQLKLNCNQEEIKFDNETNLNDENMDQLYDQNNQLDDQNNQLDDRNNQLDDRNNQLDDRNNQLSGQNNQSDKQEDIQIDMDQEFLSQPTISCSQKSEIDLTTQSLSQPSSQQTKLSNLPQKKRFFSKKDKEKKVQYNVKNFFSNDQANEFDDEQDVDKNKIQDVKPLEYDSDKLKKVKEAHKCAELGEAEHFEGEINFYLSGLKDKNPNSMRCLSIIGLTSQCLSKADFRMHLRAHDSMKKIICALMDSPKNPNLALCAACLMFVYNQDRLTMDIDPNALSLMLELLETKADSDQNQIESKHKEKILEMCKIMKTKGYGKYLKLDEVSAGTLAMETLLGLTSKRAGDWFKEELRTLKGIDYLVDQVLETSESETNDYMQQESELNKIDRSLRVIENVTCQNKENQEYCIDYKDNLFIKRCIKLYELCKNGIIYSETTTNHFLSPLLTILRVFTNLTSESQDGCIKIGNSIPEIFDIFLNSVFELPSFIVPDSRFDLIIFLLCLCLNLIESCDQLHNNFINNHSQIKRLIVMLEERCDEAKKTEQQADDFLDSEETQKQLNAETINIDSILTDLVAKSGKHMEHTIIAACISLLIGCGLKDNYDQVESVRQLLPNNSFSMMIDVITKLKEFSNLASIMTRSGIKRVEEILKVLKHL